MSEVKTKPTNLSVEDYLNAITDDSRRADCESLASLMQSVTGDEPVLWGTAIIGFGKYRYKYATGREGDNLIVGFSSRKEHIVLYGVIFYDRGIGLLDQLGKHKTGKGCLYIKKLSDINLGVLERMIRVAYDEITNGQTSGS